MINSMILLSVLGAIVIIFLLSCWLIKYFASMSEDEKRIYEDKLKCPFDGNHCGIIGRSITDQYITKTCEKCPRFKEWKK